MKAEMLFYIKTSLVDLTPCSQEHAARQVAQGKSDLDQHRWKHVVESIGNVLYQPQPEAYIRTLFPFLSSFGLQRDEQQLVWMDPSLVVGFDAVRFQGVRNPDRARDRGGFCDNLDDQTLRRTTAAAMGYRANQLGVCWLFEGLSRPALYMNVQREMPMLINKEQIEEGWESVVVAVTGPLRPAYIIRRGSKWTALAMPTYSVPLLLASGFKYSEERSGLRSQIRVHKASYRKLHRVYDSRFYRR